MHFALTQDLWKKEEFSHPTKASKICILARLQEDIDWKHAGKWRSSAGNSAAAPQIYLEISAIDIHSRNVNIHENTTTTTIPTATVRKAMTFYVFGEEKWNSREEKSRNFSKHYFWPRGVDQKSVVGVLEAKSPAVWERRGRRIMLVRCLRYPGEEKKLSSFLVKGITEGFCPGRFWVAIACALGESELGGYHVFAGIFGKLETWNKILSFKSMSFHNPAVET